MGGKRSFTVRDRRRVIHGLDDPEDEVSSEPDEVEQPEANPTHPAFPRLLLLLAQNAAALLGAGPDGRRGPPVDPNAAMEIIDMLNMLQRKTRGNLSFEEESTLNQVLAEIQSLLPQ